MRFTLWWELICLGRRFTLFQFLSIKFLSLSCFLYQSWDNRYGLLDLKQSINQSIMFSTRVFSHVLWISVGCYSQLFLSHLVDFYYSSSLFLVRIFLFPHLLNLFSVPCLFLHCISFGDEWLSRHIFMYTIFTNNAFHFFQCRSSNILHRKFSSCYLLFCGCICHVR